MNNIQEKYANHVGKRYLLPTSALESPSSLVNHARNNGFRFVDLRFTDLFGAWRQKTYMVHHLAKDPAAMLDGIYFDGSSIPCWKGVHESDMLLKPDIMTARIDPLSKDTIAVICDVHDPRTGMPYQRDPRTIAKRAEERLRRSGIADSALFGPEPEFFLFDTKDGKPVIPEGAKGSYMSVGPSDRMKKLRGEIADILEELGFGVECHHHECGIGQGEIAVAACGLVEMADRVQWQKYVTRMVAHRHGKVATFMPKPILSESGSGMHVNQSLSKDGINLFAGSGYAGLSGLALQYTAGLLDHAPALRALCAPTSNSDQRLVPHFEAPTGLSYAQANRSAAVRIPFSSGNDSKRIEARFPDPCANPYIAFSALLMAGLDGIERHLDPGPPSEFDVYDRPDGVAQLPATLKDAWDALGQDSGFLKEIVPPDALALMRKVRLAEYDDACSAKDRAARELELCLAG